MLNKTNILEIIKEEVENYLSENDNIMVDVGGNKEISLNHILQLFNKVNTKYHNDRFYSEIIKNLIKNRKITPKQWWYLSFLLKNGKSPYEAGILPPNI